MGEITIDLTKIKFEDEEKSLFLGEKLLLKNKNFIFAKNGSGKTTLSNAIKEQKSDDFEVHVFQGFESVLGENDRLDAFALSVNATKNQAQLKKLELQKQSLEIEHQQIIESITDPDNSEAENFYTKERDAYNHLKIIEDTLSKFYTTGARNISLKTAPQLVLDARSYRKNNFEKEISYAKFLKEDEIKNINTLLKAEPQEMREVVSKEVDCVECLKSVNEIIQSKVEEKTRIIRLDSQEKINFAQKGLEIHKHSLHKICTFCGNEVTEGTLLELENYFSADEVKELKEEISKAKHKVHSDIEKINKLVLDSQFFYPEFIEKVKIEINKIEESKVNLKHFLEELLKSLENKEANLFVNMNPIEIKIPNPIDVKGFNDLIRQNNEFSNKLSREQEVARKKLRYHEIYCLIQKENYNVLVNEKKNAKQLYDEKNTDLINEKNKDYSLSQKLQQLKDDILLLQPKAEKQAVENINRKLRIKVPWELSFLEGNQCGYYQVKEGENLRSVKNLSTGEKNIIGFLYFIEKLEEIKEGKSKKKIIIFDDPMNSNDDIMQYLIIFELQKLYQGNDRKKYSPEDDNIIILTHNIHFYLNVQPQKSFKDKNGKTKYDKSNFYHIRKRKFNKITSEKEDFKTSYEALWMELHDLYECGHKNSMLNSMRRIIETYTKFNSLNPTEFYRGNEEYQKLFNVNSHSIDDLEAELITEEKEQMKKLFKNIFFENGAEKHFQKHWK